MHVEHEHREVWAARVLAACAEIEAGRLEKVVVARRSRLHFERSVRACDVVRRLSNRHGEVCTIFAIRRGDATFLGATPELLVAVDGRSVRSEALAGSVDVARSDHAALLFESSKDRREHAFVAREIESRLAPLCRVARTAEIRVRRLSNVAHLVSPIHAELAQDTHVLDVAAALHPTPAVSGVPALAAARFVETTEPHPRGWYAGPVGWLDVHGDGELWVALRSGIFSGTFAEVHAGAGIVRGSSPDAEYAETALKLDAILHAAGFESAPRLGGALPTGSSRR
jgi:menaquinone-specific isochorismate synthase